MITFEECNTINFDGEEMDSKESESHFCIFLNNC